MDQGKREESLKSNGYPDFLLIGAWESRAALDDHLQSNRFSVLMGAKSLLSRPPEVVIHTVAASAVLTPPNRGTFTG